MPSTVPRSLRSSERRRIEVGVGLMAGRSHLALVEILKSAVQQFVVFLLFAILTRFSIFDFRVLWSLMADSYCIAQTACGKGLCDVN